MKAIMTLLAIAIFAGTGCAYAQTTDLISRTSTVDALIPTFPSLITDSIDINEHAIIKSIIISVTVEHEEPDDLYVMVLSPDDYGIILPATHDHGDGRKTFLISSSSHGALSGWIGDNIHGTWSLEAGDIYGDGIPGTLQSWSMIVTTYKEDTPKYNANTNDHELSVVTKTNSTRIITYSADPIIDVPDKQIPRDALAGAIRAWEEYNPSLEFREEHADPSITLAWEKFHNPEYVGIAWCDESDVCNELEIGLGANDCNGNYLQMDADFVTHTIMHEIGHALGLNHNLDENHLMYGDDEWTEIPFNTMSYVIPPAPEKYFVGQMETFEQYDATSEQIDLLNSEIIKIRQEREKALERFGLTSEVFENELVFELEPIINDMNEKYDEMDRIFEMQDPLWELLRPLMDTHERLELERQEIEEEYERTLRKFGLTHESLNSARFRISHTAANEINPILWELRAKTYEINWVTDEIDSLSEQYFEQVEQINTILEELEELDKEYENVLKKFNLTPSIYENNLLPMVNPLAYELGTKYDERNNLHMEFDSLYEQLGCYPNYELPALDQILE